MALQIPKEQRRRHSDNGFIGNRQNPVTGCGNKQPYTFEYAQKVVKRFCKYHDHRMTAYRCRYCHSWHVGNPVSL